MDNFSKLNQFKSKSEMSADPLTAAKLPAGIDQSKKGSIHDITFYIVWVNELIQTEKISRWQVKWLEIFQLSLASLKNASLF